MPPVPPTPPGPGQRSVWSFPRPPALERVGQTVRIDQHALRLQAGAEKLIALWHLAVIEQGVVDLALLLGDAAQQQEGHRGRGVVVDQR